MVNKLVKTTSYHYSCNIQKKRHFLVYKYMYILYVQKQTSIFYYNGSMFNFCLHVRLVLRCLLFSVTFNLSTRFQRVCSDRTSTIDIYLRVNWSAGADLYLAHQEKQYAKNILAFWKLKLADNTNCQPEDGLILAFTHVFVQKFNCC